jgi:hypothetical protein
MSHPARRCPARRRSELLYGPIPPTAARPDLAEGCGTTEDVQSNLVAAADADLVSSCVPAWGSHSVAAAAAAAGKEGSPSAATGTGGTGTATGPLRAATAGAGSTTPPPPAQLLQGKRPAAALGGGPPRLTPEGTASQAGPASVAGVDWRVPTGSCQPGSSAPPGASGGGTARATLTSMLAGGARLPSCEGEAETVARVPQAGTRAPVRQGAAATLRQGSSSPRGVTPASSPGTSTFEAGMGAPHAPAQQRWLTQHEMAAGACTQAGTQQLAGELADAEQASLKRMRAGSPPDAPFS